MRTSRVQKLDVSVRRGQKSWTCHYVFNGLRGGTVNSLRRKPFRFKAASNNSPFVHGLTDQYVTDRAQRKLDA